MSTVDNGDGDTESTATRHKYTNDFGFFLLNISFIALIGLHGYGIIDLSTLPGYILAVLATIVGVANVWAFGTEAMKGWREAKLITNEQ